MANQSTQSHDALKREHDLVVRKIQEDLSAVYDVLSNIDLAKHQIGSFFPDLILLNKETKRPQFIVEVKRNGNIARCLQQWKSVKDLPAAIFLFVPESDFSNAKEVSEVLGMPVGVGFYTVEGDHAIVNYNS